MINNFIWKKIKLLEKKYNIIIRYEEIRIQKGLYKYNFYVYQKNGKFEFKADNYDELKTTLQLYYD